MSSAFFSLRPSQLYVVGRSSLYFRFTIDLLDILRQKNVDASKAALKEWIDIADRCGIPQFEKCAQTMHNWFSGIVNSLYSPLTNGFTEGCNNKIKVLKRNAYGYKNFRRFRNRILHIFSHQKQTVA